MSHDLRHQRAFRDAPWGRALDCGDPVEPFLKILENEAVILPVDSETVRPYAEVRDRLRRTGKLLPQNDTWIAALALQHELPIASLDKHFDAVAGVRRLSW